MLWFCGSSISKPSLLPIVLACCCFILVAAQNKDPNCITKARWEFLIKVAEKEEIFVRRGPLTQTEYTCIHDIQDSDIEQILNHHFSDRTEKNSKSELKKQIQKAVNHFTTFVSEMQNTIDNFEIDFEKVGKEMRCKVFMRDLVAQSSWVDIYTYADKNSENASFKKLGDIFETSSDSSGEFDQAILEHIFQEHQKGQQALKKQEELKENKVVVARAGMSGLYATLQFFRAGMDVTLVNDRSEEYERALIVGFDMNWREQSRFFLGSKFAKMFGEENPDGRLSPANSSLWIQLKRLETAFKDRLQELEKLAAQKTDQKNKPLHLLFNYEVSSIQFPSDESFSYHAVLSIPSRNSDETEKQEVPDPLLFNILVCSGGVNDRMREKYIGVPKAATIEKSYTRVVFTKGSEMGKTEILNGKSEHFPIQLGIKEIQAELKNQNFQSVVNQLSDQIKKNSNIDEQILETRGQLKFGMFENVDNLPSFYILGETPAALGNLVEDIDAAIKEHKSLKNDYTKLKKTGGEKVFNSCFLQSASIQNQLDQPRE